MKTLSELKNELETIEMQMPQTFAQQRNKNQAMFLISREIEKIENPKGYEENKSHWEGHEIRF